MQRLLRSIAIALDSMPNNKLIAQELQAASIAASVKERGSKYIVKRMDVFNSRRQDYSPMLFGDEIRTTLLYFYTK